MFRFNSSSRNESAPPQVKVPFGRLAIGLLVLIGGLVIAAGVGADSLIRSGGDRVRVTQARQKAQKTSQRAPNFDVRLGRRGELDNVLKKRIPAGAKQLISQAAVEHQDDLRDAFMRLKERSADAAIEMSPLTGAVEIVKNSEGLSEAAPGRSGEEIVRNFIYSNRGLYGLNEQDLQELHFIGESVSPDSGIRMVRVEQTVNGLPVFQSESRFILDAEGRIVRSLGLMVPDASQTAEYPTQVLPAADALQRTMGHFGVQVTPASMQLVKSDDGGNRVGIRVDDPNITDTVESELVYFPAAPGVLIPAWSQVIFGVNEDWYVLADATDGQLLWGKQIRSDLSTHDARFRVYVQADGVTPADNPAPQSPSAAVPGAGTQFPAIAPSIVSMFLAQNTTASPNGWIDDCPGGVCTANETQTLGNNTLVCVDRTNGASNACDTTGIMSLDGNGRPTGNPDSGGRNRDFLGTAPRDFQTDFLPAPQGGNPEAGTSSSVAGTAGTGFLRASAVQQFYVTNWYHDKLYALGFDPAAGNFQNNNFGGGGTGNDRVLVDVQDGQANNNANFATPPDGTSGRAQMFNFTGPAIDRDGGLDTEILIHELTHGTSNRLVGNAAGLQWDIGAGMGEGWSDFYALSLLNNTNADDPNGRYATGAYATYKLATATFVDNYVYGIRRFPYSTDNSVNPLTWADVDQSTYNHSGGIAVNPLGFQFGGALEVHNVGEIWALTLWEMRSRIIAANSNDVPTGNQIALRIVTDGMKMTPSNPTFTQARDALIDADCASNACANEGSIWAAFADRGLGYGASSPIAVQFGIIAGHIGLSESFAQPNLDLNTVTVDDSIANNSGFIDPNEPVRLSVNLKNPWRAASKTATGVSVSVTSTTPGVSILSGTATYPNISANSNANKDVSASDLVIRAPQAGTCGASLNFTITVTSSLGSVARDYSVRMGQPSGTLAPVTYTRSAVGLAIPDNTGSGAIDTMTIPDDYQIADLDVRIDSLTHTYTGDVTAGIRGPSGYGTDLLTLTGWNAGGVFVNGGSSANNFVNTRFDDEAANDIISATNATAPYTNSYRPAFNSANWTPLLGASPDAVPQLSRFDGSSTLGQWKMVVSDNAGLDTGTLQGWSLIVTPQAFVCSAFTPTAAPVTISGRVVDRSGRAISRATLSLTDQDGRTRTVRSSSFGYFRFDGVPAGEGYVLNVQALGYKFEPQYINVSDSIDGLQITGWR